jgi:hypothetical protein
VKQTRLYTELVDEREAGLLDEAIADAEEANAHIRFACVFLAISRPQHFAHDHEVLNLTFSPSLLNKYLSPIDAYSAPPLIPSYVLAF